MFLRLVVLNPEGTFFTLNNTLRRGWSLMKVLKYYAVLLASVYIAGGCWVYIAIMFALPYRAKKERHKTVKFPLSWACEESLKESLEPSTFYAPPPVGS